MRIVHKTMLEAFEKCDRFGWLRYFWNGVGLDSTKAPHLAQGSAVHKGVEVVFTSGDVATGVKAALEEFDLEFDASFFPSAEIAQAWKDEYLQVIEAAVWVFGIHVYPHLMTKYNHVAAEFKVETRLTRDLSLYARPDEVMQSQFDNRFFNLSLKTEKQHNAFKHPSAQIDLGGLTEAISLATTLGEGRLEEIGGTIMLYLVTGKPDDEDGAPIIWHPGVHGWSRERPGVTPGREYAWKWKYDNPDYDPSGPVNSRTNPKTKALSVKDGWSRCNAKDYPGGIKQWVTDLLAGEFLPRRVSPLKELVYMPEPYVRDASKVNDFLEQTVAQQHLIDHNLRALQSGRKNLNQTFPQRRTSCLRYGEAWKCEFWEICWGMAGRNPLDRGFQLRQTSTQREAAKEAKRVKKGQTNG